MAIRRKSAAAYDCFVGQLFDCDGLCQVAGFIRVVSQRHTRVIGELLHRDQRNHGDDPLR